MSGTVPLDEITRELAKAQGKLDELAVRLDVQNANIDNAVAFMRQLEMRLTQALALLVQTLEQFPVDHPLHVAITQFLADQ